MKKTLAAIVFGCYALSSHAQSASAPEDPSDAWLTGPLLATNPLALPPGGMLVEPYVLWNHTNGNYDAHGDYHGTSSMADSWSTSVPIYYGITDRLTGLVILNGAHLYGTAGNSNGLRLGDLDLRLSYMLLAGDPQTQRPTVAFAVTQQLPTGRYDRLGTNPANGVGSGVSSTSLALNTETYFWMPNGRILRIRANASWGFSNGRTDVKGVSIYGTGQNYTGHANTGQSQQLDIGAEYSLDQHWALATDLIYSHNGSTDLQGSYPSDFAPISSRNGSSQSLGFAPALEYNWTARIGLIGGVQFTVHGRNVPSEVIPQIALNMLF